MLTALTRLPGAALEDCELTHLVREPIDVALAAEQHRGYEQCLEALGYRVERLPELPMQPDAVFVEDTAVVLPELAVITRPGAASRRPETASVAAALERYRPLVSIESPGTLDGGDVLQLGKRLYVGQSGRTNAEGFWQLEEIVAPHGYEAVPVDVVHCLHLKTAATEAARGTVLINPRWIDSDVFAGLRVLEVDPAEPFAANVVRAAGGVMVSIRAPRTRARLEAAGLEVTAVDQSELAKAEGGLTCCSLLFEA